MRLIDKTEHWFPRHLRVNVEYTLEIVFDSLVTFFFIFFHLLNFILNLFEWWFWLYPSFWVKSVLFILNFLKIIQILLDSFNCIFEILLNFFFDQNFICIKFYRIFYYFLNIWLKWNFLFFIWTNGIYIIIERSVSKNFRNLLDNFYIFF